MTDLVSLRKINQKADIKQFISSWEAVFDRKLSIEVYNWLFSEGNHIYCAYDDEHVVAGYCLLDIKISLNGEILKAVLCNNVFVNGFRYQKAGVFKLITEFALQDVTVLGYDFALGFPNDKAIKAHMRAGWSQSELLPFYEINKNSLFIGKSEVNIKWFSVNDEEAFHDILTFMQASRGLYSFLILRNSNFLDWRFRQNPRWLYDVGCLYDEKQMVGFFISKYFKDRSRVHLVDYCFKDSLCLSKAVAEIYKKYEVERDLKVTCIDGWCAQGDQSVFKDSGFFPSEVFSYVIYKDLQGNGLRLGTSPHLTLADNDVY